MSCATVMFGFDQYSPIVQVSFPLRQVILAVDNRQLRLTKASLPPHDGNYRPWSAEFLIQERVAKGKINFEAV